MTRSACNCLRRRRRDERTGQRRGSSCSECCAQDARKHEKKEQERGRGSEAKRRSLDIKYARKVRANTIVRSFQPFAELVHLSFSCPSAPPGACKVLYLVEMMVARLPRGNGDSFRSRELPRSDLRTRRMRPRTSGLTFNIIFLSPVGQSHDPPLVSDLEILTP